MKTIWHKKLEELKTHYEWVSDMYGVPQSPVFHAEGDVATHTQMVIDALISDKSYNMLSEMEQQYVWMSALLHDVEKRSTTYTDETGNIVSPGHAKKGAQTARQILYEQFDLPFHQREFIVQLVRHHGLPLWLMEKPNPQKSLLDAAEHTPMHLLILLATADVNGRIAPDVPELLDRIRFFEAYCAEQAVGQNPYPFTSNNARFYYFNSGQTNEPCYTPFDAFGSQVKLMSGLPGMGKDSYIRQHYKDWQVISLDAIRQKHKIKPTDSNANGWVAQQAKEQAKVFLRNKQNFVWNATNITRQMRSQLISMMSDYNAYIEIIYVEKPYKIWQQQNRQREAMVPTAALARMLHKLEVPQRSEAHEVHYITY